MRTFLCMIVLLFCVYLPSSDASFYELNKSKIGVGMTFLQSIREAPLAVLFSPHNVPPVTFRDLGVRLDYGYSPDIKIYFTPGLSFTKRGSGAPTAALGIIHTGGVAGTSVIDYYLGSVFDVVYKQESYIRFALNGYTGLLARLETESALTFIPYFGVEYGHHYFRLSRLLTSSYLFEDTNFAINGVAGMEVEMSPNLSIMVSWSFSFEVPDSAFMLQVNFH